LQDRGFTEFIASKYDDEVQAEHCGSSLDDTWCLKALEEASRNGADWLNSYCENRSGLKSSPLNPLP
jgi:hypothetical protein